MTNSTRLPAPRSMAQQNNSMHNSDPITLLFQLHDEHARLSQLQIDHSFYELAAREMEEQYTEVANKFNQNGGSEEQLSDLVTEMVEIWEQLESLSSQIADCQAQIATLNAQYEGCCVPYSPKKSCRHSILNSRPLQWLIALWRVVR